MLYEYLLVRVLRELNDRPAVSESYAAVLVTNDARLLYMLMAIDNCKQLDDDITVLREKHPNYQQLLPCIRRVYPKDKTSVIKSFEKLDAELLGAFAAAAAAEHAKNKVMVFELSRSKFKLATSEARILAYDFFRKPTVHVLQRVWNLADRE